MRASTSAAAGQAAITSHARRSSGSTAAPRATSRGRATAGRPQAPSTTTGPGSLEQVHTCPCGEVLEFGGDYGAPGTGQGWHCRNGHSWSRAGGRFADPSSGAHLLRPGDVR